MRFLIATGIYPPEIGGPAYYAKNLADALKAKGHGVEVATFGSLKQWPTGLRHLGLFLKVLLLVPGVDVVIALDTFSAAIPAYFAAAIFRKKVIVRTGGDFLWEQYVERSGDLVPLPFFYEKHRPFTRIERVYFALTKFLLARVLVVFSSNFQKNIWLNVYDIQEKNTRLIPNAVTGRIESLPPAKKYFLAYGRDIKLRNRWKLREAFARAKEEVSEIELEEGQVPQHVLYERIRTGYCLLLPSVSDISPNYILDGLRAGKPFIMTKYSEYAETYKDFGLFVDPLDANDIAQKIIQMSDNRVYEEFVKRIAAAPLSRTYTELADDFVALAKTLV
jgi:glycosyltransferase involved in cell wall biosynthesis